MSERKCRSCKSVGTHSHNCRVEGCYCEGSSNTELDELRAERDSYLRSAIDNRNKWADAETERQSLTSERDELKRDNGNYAVIQESYRKQFREWDDKIQSLQSENSKLEAAIVELKRWVEIMMYNYAPMNNKCWACGLSKPKHDANCDLVKVLLLGSENAKEIHSDCIEEEGCSNLCKQATAGQDILEERERYKSALESISKNSCCDKCQEAKLVALEALNGPSLIGEKLNG